MAVRGRNLGADARTDTAVATGGGALSASGGALAIAGRSSIQVEDLSVIVLSTNTGTVTAGIEVITVNKYVNLVATALAIITVPSGTSFLTEYTTRDGTLAWEAGYENASARVFPKGTQIRATSTAGSTGYDTFGISLVSHEYGAPPALG